VLLSTFNGDKYLDEFLHSIYEQDFSELTLIIRDDISTDNTPSILLSHQTMSKINIQILPSQGHLGPAQSFLHLLSNAGSDFDFYAFGDQDDVWKPDKISRAVNKLSSTTGKIPTLYCSCVEYVDEGLKHLQWSRVPRRIGFGNALVENIATGCTMVMNQRAREVMLSGLPEKCLMHDWWSYIAISCFGRVVFDDYAGVKYRQHKSNAVGAATSFPDEINRRLNRFIKAEGGVFRFSDQVQSFLDKFGDMIPEEKIGILKLILSSKLSIKKRFRLAISRDIWRQKWFDNVILRALIVINRY
jgi:glycosyltransferase involved in cell wall biosynthesis